VEILERKNTADRIAAVDIRPPRQLVQSRCPCLCCEPSLCHPTPPIVPAPSRELCYRARPRSLPFPAANHAGLVTLDQQEFCYNFGPNRSGSMNLNLKRLFARSMTGSLEPVAPPSPPSPRSPRQKATLITLAGVLAIFGALAGGYYFAMRPVTLR